MGFAAYEGGLLLKLLGGLVILVGIGLAGYVLYLDRSNWEIAAILFIVLLILGAAMVARGSYTRRQNAPLGREEIVREK